ncbi:VG15 protein [Propionibacterium australiense]|uniref:tRNA nuclease CdiA C-terminal domain-containing protein n=1 Tax=Propionibacterium australiense TaxID=119981 RepID=A0A8B3FLC3_9ACTN|nr:hypothetical protein [Propionibacterium australiense]RLP12257.1 hypothetical protein D7U36_03080 [Propionibacterium australiense]
MLGRRDIDRYTSAIDVAVKAAERQLAGFLAGLDLSQPGAIEALAAYVEALAQQYGTVAAAAAADWYEELRAADGLADGFTALVDDTIDGARVQHSTRYLATTGDSQALAGKLGGLLQRHIFGAGRQTINANMDADPADVRYARVPRGPKTCAFCSMLASRGWVYRSKESASQRKRGGRYHDYCDCAIVPCWGPRTPSIDGYDPDALYEQYQQARDAAKTTDEATILAEMRRQHPDRYTDGVYPKRGSITVPDGLMVAPHEMDTAERLAGAGMNIRFRAIDRSQGAKNPDVEIDIDGDCGVWEMKSPEGNSKNTIANQFSRARKQSDRMVIDLARCGLPDDLAKDQIRRRFFGQQKLKELIIIDHDGAIDHLSL